MHLLNIYGLFLLYIAFVSQAVHPYMIELQLPLFFLFITVTPFIRLERLL